MAAKLRSERNLFVVKSLFEFREVVFLRVDFGFATFGRILANLYVESE